MDSLAWRHLVVEMVKVLQEMSQVDTEHLWEYHLPGLAATSEQLAAIEIKLGEPLDPIYCSFLEVAGGWRSVYQMVDLFGPEDLLRGEASDRARRQLAYLDDEVLQSSGVRRDDLLPIACSSDSKTLFVLGLGRSSIPGRIVWFHGVEVDRFTSFLEFFTSLIEYNRLEVGDLRGH